MISDVRVAYMRAIKSMGVSATLTFLYPRMIALHVIHEDDGFAGPNGRVRMPPLMRCGYAWMEPHGAYLLGE